jgi:protein tyrosine/serine phosphatase
MFKELPDTYCNLLKRVNHLIISHTIPNTEEDVNSVMKNLWLGNRNIANNLPFITDNNIKYIINISSNLVNKFDFIDYTNFYVRDRNACSSDVLTVLETGAKVIDQCIRNNNCILVHCKKGHHRSASIVAYYLMKYRGMSLIDAIEYIKSVRPTTFQKMTCVLRTLIDYELSRI